MSTVQEPREVQADSISPAIISGGVPGVPASSLTLDPFATRGYVTTSIGWRLGVDQVLAAIGPLNAGDGTYWIALHEGIAGAVAGWTRQVGTHYIWQQNATQPSEPLGGLIFAAATVSSGAITAITYVGIRQIQEQLNITSDATVDAAAVWHWDPGGVVNFTGTTLAFQGNIVALPTQQLFDGTGTVQGPANIDWAYAEWFKKPAATDWSAAFQAVNLFHPHIRMLARTYQFDTRLQFFNGKGAHPFNGLTLEGSGVGRDMSVLQFEGGGTAAIELDGVNHIHRNYRVFAGSGAHQDGMINVDPFSPGLQHSEFHNVVFEGWNNTGFAGLRFRGAQQVLLTNLDARGCYDGIVIGGLQSEGAQGESNAITIVGCKSRQHTNVALRLRAGYANTVVGGNWANSGGVAMIELDESAEGVTLIGIYSEAFNTDSIRITNARGVSIQGGYINGFGSGTSQNAINIIDAREVSIGGGLTIQQVATGLVFGANAQEVSTADIRFRTDVPTQYTSTGSPRTQRIQQTPFLFSVGDGEVLRKYQGRTNLADSTRYTFIPDSTSHLGGMGMVATSSGEAANFVFNATSGEPLLFGNTPNMVAGAPGANQFGIRTGGANGLEFHNNLGSAQDIIWWYNSYE